MFESPELQLSKIKFRSPKIQGTSAAVRLRACSRRLYVSAYTILKQSYTGVPYTAPRQPLCSLSELNAIPTCGLFKRLSPRPRELHYILMRLGFNRSGAAPVTPRKCLGSTVFSLSHFVCRAWTCILRFQNRIFKVWRSVLKCRSVSWSSNPPQ